MASPADLQPQTYTVREKDSNENLNFPESSTNSVSSQLNSGVIQTTTSHTDCDTINTSLTQQTLTNSTNHHLVLMSSQGSGVKRVHSSQDMSRRHRSPSCRRRSSDIFENSGRCQDRYEDSQAGTERAGQNVDGVLQKREANNSSVRFRNTKHSEESWSEEEEGEVSDDETPCRPPCRQSFSTLSSEGVFSEEDISDRSGNQDGSGDNGLLSTGSAENLQAELTKLTYIPDGLSDREKTVKKMKNKVNSPDRMKSETDTSSDECSDITVSSAIHKTRSVESSTHW
ncbi:uncharacterized protein LOC131945154 [Physella acuta]|uniref:uncharacterized protein LOC131945154 n=1 Tax=Physella acuta TaxID=109671 RepID=UPI0027DD398B|nr:uncharacterized protein LOC131945154 [Physella acuta]